jgi:hypothetical protein
MQGKREAGRIRGRLRKPRRGKEKIPASGEFPPGRTVRQLKKGSHVIESQHSLRFVSDGVRSPLRPADKQLTKCLQLQNGGDNSGTEKQMQENNEKTSTRGNGKWDARN